MDIMGVACTYFVEIRHQFVSGPGWTGWNHVYRNWQTTDSYADAYLYAQQVRADYPATSEIRIVEQAAGCPDDYIPIV